MIPKTEKAKIAEANELPGPPGAAGPSATTIYMLAVMRENNPDAPAAAQ
jgi:hypothetical protein